MASSSFQQFPLIAFPLAPRADIQLVPDCRPRIYGKWFLPHGMTQRFTPWPGKGVPQGLMSVHAGRMQGRANADSIVPDYPRAA